MNILFILFCFLPFSVFALSPASNSPLAPVPLSTVVSTAAANKSITLNFDKISVLSFIDFIYGDILKINFAVHPDLLDSKKVVTVHFQNDISKANLSDFVVNLLSGLDITVEKKKGYLFLSPSSLEDEVIVSDTEIFFYRPKYRSVASLVDITSSLFKTGRFSGQRAVRESVQQLVPSVVPTPLKTASVASPVNSRAAQDTGTNATSLIDKNEVDSFIFQGSEKEILLLQKLLVQLDVPVPEVVVKGMVYEVTTTAKDGSAFSLALNLMSGGLSVGQVLKNGNSISFKNSTIDAVFSALSTDSRFKSVSNPSLRVRSGSSARFSVGSDVPVLGAVQLDKAGNPIQSVEYKPSGVIFDIKPLIRDSVIDLTISQQISSFVATTTGVNNSPTLIKREISTTVGASDGDVIVLGGLDEDRATSDTNGFSFLPSWTKGVGSDISKTQILLVLHVQKI